ALMPRGLDAAASLAASSCVRWIEEFPLLEPMFEGWPELDKQGQMTPRDVPGHGLVVGVS
ncbi:MAG: hypothetical protein NWT00_02650, partial [Beijerinckiaceae bacterium]|nr:hypothetical protein [Beijerinckiaceae bacterium]